MEYTIKEEMFHALLIANPFLFVSYIVVLIATFFKQNREFLNEKM